ncbi:MAG: T9SS type A sorting domain-containing protein [Sphingobacteriaceae bacterium]|nr:T9SS type A sorting domain-containing protein [Sphingobacteriaceae bacterium]
MKSLHKAAFLLLTVLCSLTISAAPGDTTWVTIYNQRKLTYYGNYDTTTTLPTGLRFRKIRLHYILGTYSCPGNPQYCGSWDYTTQIFARPPGNDSVEIARVITPYATNWLSQNKKHDYVIDVTDYSPILQGNLGIRFGYQGYSYGFHVTVKLEMIEGIPAMDALQIKNIYDGYFPYGNPGNSIENYLTNKTFSYAAPATKAFIKNSISGHGADNNNCAEFCSKYYQLNIDGNQIAQTQLWRNNCGINHVYPQTGTWLYDRANWCPGAVVWPIYHDISGITTANTNFSVDINMESYTDNGSAGYSFESQLITYSVANHSRDISIEDIVAPTSNENYFRNNINCSHPIIKVKNTGTTTATQIVFSYGLQGQTPLSYTWTGSIPFLAEEDIVFPSSVSVFTANTIGDFEVNVVAVNGVAGDEDTFNNTYKSKTGAVSIFPDKFVVILTTNNATDPGTLKNETTWKLYDENNVLIASRSNANNLTLFQDTVTLQPGCYKFSIDDAGCDGFSWWAYQYYNPNPGTGTLRFDYANGPGTFQIFNGDFGCNVTKYFRVNTVSTNLTKAQTLQTEMDVYPNPANENIYIRLHVGAKQIGHLNIYDISGRKVLEQDVKTNIDSYEKVDIRSLSAGSYLLELKLDDGTLLTKKLIIAK